MNKIIVVTLAMVLVASMAYAGVASNGLLLAKKSHENTDSNTGADSPNDGGTGTQDQKQNKDNKEINNPLHPNKDDTKDISDNPSENCSHGSCATPITPTNQGGGACSDSVGHHCPDHPPHIPHIPGNFPCHFPSLEHRCIPTHFPTSHHTVVIHKTKVIHKKDVVSSAVVFVPGIGLVQPFNCKLNENNGKISCEFVVVKVVN